MALKKLLGGGNCIINKCAFFRVANSFINLYKIQFYSFQFHSVAILSKCIDT